MENVYKCNWLGRCKGPDVLKKKKNSIIIWWMPVWRKLSNSDLQFPCLTPCKQFASMRKSPAERVEKSRPVPSTHA